ncbi:MAG TPA: hypothetical protein VJB64_04150, partial [Patescibacteria group bacterium]|nr:hypothetical protein [Patescibacteria group bacterium]
MSNLLIGLLCGLVAGIPFDFGREGWVKKWLILTVSWTVISTFIIWLVLPGFVGPLWGGKIWLLLFLGLVFNLVYSASGESDTYGVQCKSFHPWRVVTFMLSFCLIPLVVGLQSCAAFHHEDYRAFVAQDMEKREWKSDMNPVNTAHIRMVSEEQAIWLAQKALGQSSDMGLGSRFRIIEITIQKVKDRLVWVAPLEFQDFRAWEASGTSPGYVTVDAEDPNKPAELHDGFSLRYMQNAYYEFYLERHVYEHGYRFKGTTDYTFEIDDEGKPFMVVTVYEPTIGYKGEQVTEVLVVDPQTGDMVSYAPKLAPEWIDRIIPSTFAKERLVDYGEFVHGWKNSWWGEKDVNVPTVVRHNGKKPAGCDVRCQNVADTLSLTW